MEKLHVYLLLVTYVTGALSTTNIYRLPTEQNNEHFSTSFHTENINNEYIAQFHYKYWPKARKKFLLAALRMQNLTEWTIVPRDNPSSRYPSDFDILRTAKKVVNAEKLHALKAHPAIKRIVQQRSVKRVLNYASANITNPPFDCRRTLGLVKNLHHNVPSQVTSILQANVLWKLGITGEGIKVAVFDTGLTKSHPHFRKVKERTNWTNEKTLDDGVSHGTFVAGVIASARECLGFAPDAELHIYRVFTNSQVSYTSWFLDAFNYAIFKKINILNLSIGGPDFMDQPFVEKVLELSANKVIMISAIGNDGPLYGTLNNPGDQSDVIGVGGIGYDDRIAKFSSRGMTTWELPCGYGRLKPDIVTYGSQVEGSDVRSGCRSLSGTSVSSPVVAGAATLLASGALHKLKLINPSSLKQVLIEGATRLPDYNMFEQGHGKLNILKSMQLLLSYKPKVTLSPASLDFTESYMWPYSSQALFYGGLPVIVNVTILNGIAVSSKVVGQPQWYPYADGHGNMLNISVTYSPILWPWAGWLAVHIVVNEHGQHFEGVSKGHVSLTVESYFIEGNRTFVNNINFPISVKITPTPPRHKRIIWDQYHSLRYPPGYIPRDNLKVKSDPLDWRSDHIHTNFREMYNHLRNSGYYVDILREPYTCFNASAYGTLLLVDPEEEFFDEEINSLQSYVYDLGLSVIVFADWYNTTVMKKIKFFDENTRQWWIPDTGGANIPAVNDLLKPFGISFNDFVGEGYFKMGDHSMYYASGTSIGTFPKEDDDILIGTYLNNQGDSILDSSKTFKKEDKLFLPILGLFQARQSFRENYVVGDKEINEPYIEESNANQIEWEHDLSEEKNPLLNKRVLLHFADGAQKDSPPRQTVRKSHKRTTANPEGRIGVYGDSNCLDSTHLDKACFWLLNTMLDYAMNSHKSSLLKNLNRISEFKSANERSLPLRLSGSSLHKYSKVIDTRSKLKKPFSSNECEHLKWTTGIVVNSTDLETSTQNITELSEDPQDKQLLDALLMEISDSTFNENLSSTQYIDFNLRNSLRFLVVLTFFMFVLFIIFLRQRRRRY